MHRIFPAVQVLFLPQARPVDSPPCPDRRSAGPDLPPFGAETVAALRPTLFVTSPSRGMPSGKLRARCISPHPTPHRRPWSHRGDRNLDQPSTTPTSFGQTEHGFLALASRGDSPRCRIQRQRRCCCHPRQANHGAEDPARGVRRVLPKALVPSECQALAGEPCVVIKGFSLAAGAS